MNIILETERLILREFVLSDTDFIIQLLNSPGWLAFIGDRHVTSEEQATNYLVNGPLKSYKQNGFGLSMVELINERIPIGMCGILKRDELESPDIGFAFLPEYSGHGYAYEITSALIKFARERLELKQLFAITVPANERSIRLLQKTGFTYRKKHISVNTKEELFLFSLNPL